ncbi:MAG: hypothetical protein VYD39_04890 [Bacteroidota bacterium]|nr:hypothetical protein [Bacteroidota bacterium]
MILILPFQNIETSQIQMILAPIGKQQDSKVETAQTEGFHTYSLSSSSHLSLLLCIYSTLICLFLKIRNA